MDCYLNLTTILQIAAVIASSLAITVMCIVQRGTCLGWSLVKIIILHSSCKDDKFEFVFLVPFPNYLSEMVGRSAEDDRFLLNLDCLENLAFVLIGGHESTHTPSN